MDNLSKNTFTHLHMIQVEKCTSQFCGHNNQRFMWCYFQFYGRETWSLTLRDEGRLRVFENRVLRRVFGPKRDEVTG